MDSRIIERDHQKAREPKRRAAKLADKSRPPLASTAQETPVVRIEKTPDQVCQVVGNSTFSGKITTFNPFASATTVSKPTTIPPENAEQPYSQENGGDAAVATMVANKTSSPQIGTPSTNDQLLLALNSLTEESNVIATVTQSGEIKLEAKDGRNVSFDVTQLRDFLHEVISSRDEILKARQLAESAEKKVKLLRTELGQISELVREDKLTGALNRRGLDEAFVREIARSARRSSPLCVALLDLDNFKSINDTFGHQAGDDALIHLTHVIRDTLRPNDVFARYGGEEFLILLPDSDIAEAVAAISRLQRELSRRPFLHNDQTIAITFSAGVALRQPGETQESVISRADSTQYQAKQAGKNRVFSAQ